MSGKRNFLITGAGSGFGRALATEALSSGYSVIGTVRSEAARQEFSAMDPARARAIVLDVTDFAAIGPEVARAERDIGPIDVLVNSAGYGHEGTLEESPLEEMRRQFDVNVFGAVAMIKAVLPFMRERRRGHIINITSMAGYVGLAGVPYYGPVLARPWSARCYGVARQRDGSRQNSTGVSGVLPWRVGAEESDAA